MPRNNRLDDALVTFCVLAIRVANIFLRAFAQAHEQIEADNARSSRSTSTALNEADEAGEAGEADAVPKVGDAGKAEDKVWYAVTIGRDVGVFDDL